jgi:type IV pilus assembly protein PilY1
MMKDTDFMKCAHICLKTVLRQFFLMGVLMIAPMEPGFGSSCPELADVPLDHAAESLSGGPVVLIAGERPGDTIVVQAIYTPDQWWGNVKAHGIDAESGEINETPIWSAAEKLDQQDWESGRMMATYNGVSGTGFRYGWLNDSQKRVLSGGGGNETLAEDRLKYLRGERRLEQGNGGPYRDRVHLLGDIVHSRPVHHKGMVYVGANDGMLHAFNANDGQEVFAYVPGLVFDTLPELWDPDYSHRYYVDGSPVIKTVNERTLLVGGLGKGGKGYYCLDVSKIQAIDNEEDLAGRVKWEYPDPVTLNEHVAATGYSFDPASIVNSRAGWIVIVGNGYGSTTETAALLVLDADTGKVKTLIDTGKSSCNGLSTPTPVDVDRDDLVDYVYAGDLQGNLWKFDFTSKSIGNWDVAYYAGSIPSPVFRAMDPEGKPQPITTAPGVISHCLDHLPGYMVIFGTGKYLGSSDPTNRQVQTVYGIWDYGDDGDDSEYLGLFNRGRDQVLSNQPSKVSLLRQEVVYSGMETIDGSRRQVRVLSDYPLVWATARDTGGEPDPSSLQQNHAGWYFDLPLSGERIIETPMVHHGNVIFTSFVPPALWTSSTGYAIAHEIAVCTGGRAKGTTWDVTGDGSIKGADRIEIPIPDPEDPSKENIVRLSPTGIGFPNGVHAPAIIKDAEAEIETKYFGKAEGGVEILRENSLGGAIYYWREAEP